jgi:hypothetical protein
MTTTPGDQNSGFVDLSRIDQVKSVAVHARGNIIHNTSPDDPAGAAAESSRSHIPEIVLHRTGDDVSAIEFVCPCGRRAMVRISYDAE